MNEFLLEIKSLLGKEFPQFLNFYNSEECYRGLRVNTLKCSIEKLSTLLPFKIEQTPFCDCGFYIPKDVKSLGNNPLHHAGAFYIQEPSATSAVTMLNVKKDDFVLDLCAAPGGKSTQIGAKLSNEGLLWSNEIIKSRANILLSNIERMGISNAVVSNCYPEILCNKLTNKFDKILVDAPCSGEGMFRRNDEAINHWSKEHVESCAVRQLHILESAKNALKDGGELVYSTCTFSVEENENVIKTFLKNNSNFELIDANISFGRKTMEYACRIFPMDGGEGHFAAKLRKKGNLIKNYYKDENIKEYKTGLEFYDSIFINRPFGEKLLQKNNKIYISPKNLSFNTDGLNVLRTGVILGEITKNRIEPHHSAFMSAKKDDCVQAVDIDITDKRINQFLHGEEIDSHNSEKGYSAVCVNGITTGYGKLSNGRLKNKYPKGLRTLK